MAPARGGGFNAFSPQKMPLAFSVGRATSLQGLSRYTFCAVSNSQLLLGQTHMIVTLNGTPGYYVGNATLFKQSSTGNAATHLSVAQINMASAGFTRKTTADNADGDPDAAMCSKFSVRLRNMSKAVDVEGVVRCLNMAAGVQLQTSGDYENLLNYVDAHPRTTTFGAAELRATRQWDTHPVDQSKYHNFASPGVPVSDWLGTLEDPAMSTLVFIFPSVPNNNYELTAAGHYYARYRVTGPLANMATHPPTQTVSMLNRLRDEAEKVGSDGYAAGKRILQHAEGPFGEALGVAAGAALLA